MQLLLFEPRQVERLVVAKFAPELFRPGSGLLDGVLQLIVFIGELVPVPMLRISILEHPGGSLAFLLKDHGYALGCLGYVRDFVEMTGGLGILNQHNFDESAYRMTFWTTLSPALSGCSLMMYV